MFFFPLGPESKWVTLHSSGAKISVPQMSISIAFLNKIYLLSTARHDTLLFQSVPKDVVWTRAFHSSGGISRCDFCLSSGCAKGGFLERLYSPFLSFSWRFILLLFEDADVLAFRLFLRE